MLGGLHSSTGFPVNLTAVPLGFEGFGFPIKVTHSPGMITPCAVIKNYPMGISYQLLSNLRKTLQNEAGWEEMGEET